MTNKERYRILCKNEKYANNIYLFAQPFWLDAVAENWDVCMVSESENERESECESECKIIAVLPYCWKGFLLTKRIYLPDFNFYQSIIFLKDVKNEIKIIEELFNQLPKTVKSYFKFLPEYNTINLSKLNYTKEDYFTYIIPKHQQTLILSNNHKRNIQKGIKQHYSIKNSKNIAASFALLTATFARQQLAAKISLDEFKKINALVKKHHCGKILDCFDSNKNLLATIFIVEDAQTVYYLLGGYDTQFKNSGGMTLLLHHSIEYALQQQKEFNFCGSTKKSIAQYFEGFGAEKNAISIWKKIL